MQPSARAPAGARWDAWHGPPRPTPSRRHMNDCRDGRRRPADRGRADRRDRRGRTPRTRGARRSSSPAAACCLGRLREGRAGLHRDRRPTVQHRHRRARDREPRPRPRRRRVAASTRACYGKVRIKADVQATASRCSSASPARATSRRTCAAAPTTSSATSTTRPFHVEYRHREPASVARARPATQRFWDASVQGDGAQALAWDVEDGDWSVVVMNADGSPGVDAGSASAPA